jgi:hypothetical protein
MSPPFAGRFFCCKTDIVGKSNENSPDELSMCMPPVTTNPLLDCIPRGAFAEIEL